MKIQSKVLDQEGYAVEAVIKEIPLVGYLGVADVVADPATGDFTMIALSNSSMIQVSALGYTTQTFAATTVPAEIRLKVDPALIINGTVTTKPVAAKAKDNTLLYVAAGALLLGFALFDNNKPKPATQKRTTRTPTKKRIVSKPKMVVV